MEIDPVLLLTDKQLKAEVDKLTPLEKTQFEDYKNFAEDWKDKTGDYEPIDHVMKHLVKAKYLGIPPAVAAQVVQPEEGAVEVLAFQESSSDKALITAVFPSTDPAVLTYNLKGKAAEHTDDDYVSIGSDSDEGECFYPNLARWPS